MSSTRKYFLTALGAAVLAGLFTAGPARGDTPPSVGGFEWVTTVAAASDGGGNDDDPPNGGFEWA